MNELNFYEILDLDPTVDDPAEIERRLQEKQRLWSRQAVEGTPRDSRLAARNLKLLDAMRQLFADPSRRALMAHKAKLRQERRMREARSRLSELLDFAKNRVDDLDGFITRDCARYVRELGRDEVARMIAAAGITPRPQKTVSPVLRRDTLEPTTAKRVRDGLEHIDKRDLYDFLGLTRRCTAKSLCEKAEQMSKALLHTGRNDDQTTAAKELAGQCMAIFATDLGKERYNNTLTEEKLDAALKDFLTLAGQDSIIDQKELAELLAVAARQGIAPTDATAYIRTTAQRRKWLVLEAEPENLVPSLPPCGYCGCFPRHESDVFCWNCNRKLTLNCPHCGKLLGTSQSTCTDCGTSVEDAEIVENYFKEAQQAHNRNEPDAALEHLEACLALWPQWAEATALQQAIFDRRANQQRLAKKLVALMRERRMSEAQDCLAELQKDADKPREGEDDPYARAADMVNKSLAEANRVFAEGEQHKLEGRLFEAGQCYEQALVLCADLQPALSAIHLVPPVAPTQLQATPLEHETVRLVWTPGRENAHLAYTLIRKEGGAPANPQDGTVLFSAENAVRFDDTTATGGVLWYYTVFSVRHNVPSAQGASAGPILLAPPVTHLAAVPGDGVVTLSWLLPANACGVSVIRHNPPEVSASSASETVSVPATRGKAIDSGLRNGVTYTYTVTALYADSTQPSGQQAAPGIQCRMAPMPGLEAVCDLVCTQPSGLNGQDGSVHLSWTSPSVGSVCLLQSPADSPFPAYIPGDSIAPENLEQYGEPLPHAGTGSLTLPAFAASFGNSAWQHRVIPVTVHESMAVLGKACLITDLRDVEQVETVFVKGQLALQWQWPEHVREVLVCWHTTDRLKNPGFPDSPDCATASRALCSLDDYTRHNGFLLTGISPQKLYLTLYAKTPGQDSFAPGVNHFTSMGVLDVVRYRVVRTGLFSKSATAIELLTDHVDELADLQVRGKENCIPLTLTDGIPLVHVEHLRFRNGQAQIPVPKRYRTSKLFIKLFHANPEANGTVRLMPAAPDELKLW